MCPDYRLLWPAGIVAVTIAHPLSTNHPTDAAVVLKSNEVCGVIHEQGHSQQNCVTDKDTSLSQYKLLLLSSLQAYMRIFNSQITTNHLS